MGFDFNERDVALRLRDFAKSDLAARPVPPRDTPAATVILVKAPDDGVPARTATTPDESARNEYVMGYADCQVLTTYTTTDGAIRELDDTTTNVVNRPTATDWVDISDPTATDWQDEASMEVRVYNPYNYRIDEYEEFHAFFVDGCYVAANMGTKIRIFQAPSGGIAAISGTTLGSASCTGYRINTSGQLESTGDTGVTVLNMSATAVAANAYIQAVRINGQWVANWEDCT